VRGPVYHPIPPGSKVIVVPDGALHQLAFETLLVAGPQPHYCRLHNGTLSTRAGGWRQPISVRTETAAAAGRSGAQHREGDCSCRGGAGAVPAVYAKASLAQFTHIHFATHATASLQSPLNSAIVLSHQGESYKVYARDVAGLPLTGVGHAFGLQERWDQR
jgi:hypothetical protein